MSTIQIICDCGTANRATAKFCSGCGKLLATQPSQPSQQTGRLPAQTLLNDRYLILSMVGQGGMGAVYRVEDTVSNQILAVKELSTTNLPTHQERLEAVEMFDQEARLLQTLRHQNLPFVTDRFSLGDRHFLVMEYIDGATLQEMIDAQGSGFDESTVLGWAEQLCQVLNYLHKQSPPIIFRDLKPDNIMLASDTGQLKLIDFGIARAFKAGQSIDTVALGTNLFAAPEQFGRGQTEARSDIYSLGVTMCCLLTGQ